MARRMASKIALVTGGGGDIGEAKGRVFAEEGGAVASTATARPPSARRKLSRPTSRGRDC